MLRRVFIGLFSTNQKSGNISKYFKLKTCPKVDRGLHLFDKDNGDEIIELEQDGIVTSCDFSSNGLYFACTVGSALKSTSGRLRPLPVTTRNIKISFEPKIF